MHEATSRETTSAPIAVARAHSTVNGKNVTVTSAKKAVNLICRSITCVSLSIDYMCLSMCNQLDLQVGSVCT